MQNLTTPELSMRVESILEYDTIVHHEINPDSRRFIASLLYTDLRNIELSQDMQGHVKLIHLLGCKPKSPLSRCDIMPSRVNKMLEIFGI